MEILLDQIKLVDRDLDKLTDKYQFTLRQLAKEKKIYGCLDLVLDLVANVVGESTFCYYYMDEGEWSKATGRTFRVFNGMYYEKVNERFICEGMKKWLHKGGLSPAITLRIDKRLNDTIVNYCLAKRLKPRFTLMCFENGVVDFAETPPQNNRYPVLHEFDKKYDVVKQYDFKYDTTAHRRAVLWKNFLGETVNFIQNPNGVLPETIKRHQLQMFLGSCLMDRSQHSFEYFMILQGDGANGKSVIFRVLRDLFGKDEVSPLDLSQFTKVGDERLRAAANLEGKRLMFCPEENIKNVRTFQFIKQLASGESMAARKIGGNIGEVECPPILMLNTNHKWTAGDFLSQEDMKDKSMLRRVQIINFCKSIPVGQRDTNLSKRLMREKAGIFAWLLVGWANLRKNNYRMPENEQDQIDILMEKARNSVRVNDKDVSGVVALYVERKGCEAVDMEGLHRLNIKSEDIYANFLDFCRAEGLEPVTQQKFGRDMVTIGFERYKNEKNAGGDNKIYYKVYLKKKRVADNFMLNVPTLLDEAEGKVYHGEDFDEDNADDDGSTFVD